MKWRKQYVSWICVGMALGFTISAFHAGAYGAGVIFLSSIPINTAIGLAK